METLNHATIFGLLIASPQILALGLRQGKQFLAHGRLTYSLLITTTHALGDGRVPTGTNPFPLNIIYDTVKKFTVRYGFVAQLFRYFASENQQPLQVVVLALR
jgi:hypothetical protein